MFCFCFAPVPEILKLHRSPTGVKEKFVEYRLQAESLKAKSQPEGGTQSNAFINAKIIL